MDHRQLYVKLREQLAEPVAVLGYGVEGESTLSLLIKAGFQEIEVLDCEPRELPSEIAGCFGREYLAHLQRFKTIIRSAGVRPFLPELVEYRQKGGQLTSQVQLFFDLYPGSVVGITGTAWKRRNDDASLLCTGTRGIDQPCWRKYRHTRVRPFLQLEEDSPLDTAGALLLSVDGVARLARNRPYSPYNIRASRLAHFCRGVPRCKI